MKFQRSHCRASYKEGWPTGNADCSHGKQSLRCSFAVAAAAAFVVVAVAFGAAACGVAESDSRLGWGCAVVAWEEAVVEDLAGSFRSFVLAPAVSDRFELLTAGYLASGEGDAAGVGSVAGA